MKPATANPTVKEYNLCKEFGWNPQFFQDQVIQLPSRKEVLKWLIFGKPLKITVKKGIDSKKVESFLAILSEERIQQEEEMARMEREAMLRTLSGG